MKLFDNLKKYFQEETTDVGQSVQWEKIEDTANVDKAEITSEAVAERRDRGEIEQVYEGTKVEIELDHEPISDELVPKQVQEQSTDTANAWQRMAMQIRKDIETTEG